VPGFMAALAPFLFAPRDVPALAVVVAKQFAWIVSHLWHRRAFLTADPSPTERERKRF